MADLARLFVAIATGDRAGLDALPSLVRAGVARDEEFFVAECRAQCYAGDTPSHAAAFAYRVAIARELVARGADVRARNRRDAEPLHAAVMGSPDTPRWDPDRQVAMIDYLVRNGADPNARAMGGVTPLQRAVRNRCAAAVAALLRLGADPRLANDRGSTAADLARWTTGRGGTGSPAAKTGQRVIIGLLDDARGRGE